MHSCRSLEHQGNFDMLRSLTRHLQVRGSLRNCKWCLRRASPEMYLHNTSAARDLFRDAGWAVQACRLTVPLY